MKRTDRKPKALDPGTRRMFSYLDGELGPVERTAFEREMAADPVLSRKTEACRSLLATLDQLAAFAPSSDFAVRVMASLHTRRSLWARVHAWLGGSPLPAAPNVLANLLDEGLSAGQVRTLSAFLARDPEAAAALAAWRRLCHRLDQLAGFEPSPGFADRVMTHVEVAPASVRRRGALAGRLRALWPRRGDRLAAASGIAFGPTAVVAVTAYMLVSGNPLVTASNVASFVWTKLTTAMSGLAEAAFSGTSGSAFGFLDVLAAPAPVLAASLILFGGLTLVSGWVLYKNVIKVSELKSRYVPA